MKRVSTGITGMDELIQGGFPERTVNLITAPSGGGKTLFTLQYIYNGAKDYDEPGIFITLEESRESIDRVTENFGMDIAKYEKEGKLFIIDLGEMRKEVKIDEEVSSGMLSFEALEEALGGIIKMSRAKRFALDSLTAVGLSYALPSELRQAMFRFVNFLRIKDVTSLLITESVEGTPGLTRYGVEQYIADSLIVVGLDSIKGELRRTICIRKMRFTKHDTSIHPFLIMNDGIEISPKEKVF
ncbi:MAG: ATPase domain-containing protein [Halobacteriota archaeon]|nr:ATPase domain-containing protein [Halobacteriota archaeon]